MIAVVLATLIQTGTAQSFTPVEPADWTCAEPLIARNHSQRVDSTQLALRIADECTRPYRSRPIQSDADRFFEQNEKTTYGYRASIFTSEIEIRIQQARRREAIKLN